MSITVTTPTGQIGARVVERLLEAGADVTVLVRDAARLAPAVRDRVRVVEGDLADAAALREATRGARVLFLLVPPIFRTDDWAGWQRAIGRNAAEAVRANGVGRVVLLSSAGAQRDDMFAVSRLGEIEQQLFAAAPDVTTLRAGFFLENFLSAAGSIAAEGNIYMTLPPDRPQAMVATRDIGDVAARVLLDRSWSGHVVRGVHGAADVTPAEVAATFSEVLGRPVRYVRVPDEGMQGALLGMGASPHVAEEYPKLMDAIGRLDYRAEPRTAETTTATTVAQWAREVLVPAVQSVPVPA